VQTNSSHRRARPSDMTYGPALRGVEVPGPSIGKCNGGRPLLGRRPLTLTPAVKTLRRIRWEPPGGCLLRLRDSKVGRISATSRASWRALRSLPLYRRIRHAGVTHSFRPPDTFGQEFHRGPCRPVLPCGQISLHPCGNAQERNSLLGMSQGLGRPAPKGARTGGSCMLSEHGSGQTRGSPSCLRPSSGVRFDWDPEFLAWGFFALIYRRPVFRRPWRRARGFSPPGISLRKSTMVRGPILIAFLPNGSGSGWGPRRSRHATPPHPPRGLCTTAHACRYRVSRA